MKGWTGKEIKGVTRIRGLEEKHRFKWNKMIMSWPTYTRFIRFNNKGYEQTNEEVKQVQEEANGGLIGKY